MIVVKKKEGETSQKMVSTFLRRVKKSNLVSRFRKTRHHSKKRTKRVAKIKALTTVNYLEKNKYNKR